MIRRRAYLKRSSKPLRRTRLNRIGAVTRRYLDARRKFLLDLLGDKDSVTIHCADTGIDGVVVREPNGNPLLGPGFHVHHDKKRSTHPELRNDPSNFVLLTMAAHQKRHAV